MLGALQSHYEVGRFRFNFIYLIWGFIFPDDRSCFLLLYCLHLGTMKNVTKKLLMWFCSERLAKNSILQRLQSWFVLTSLKAAVALILQLSLLTFRLMDDKFTSVRGCAMFLNYDKINTINISSSKIHCTFLL